MKHSPQTRQYRTMRRISLLAVCFLVLIVTALIDARYATGQAILMAAALLVYALPFGRVNRQLQKQLDAAARKLDSDSLSFLDSTLPVAAIRRNGALVWYNEAFHELIGQGPAPGRDIREAIPGFQPQKFTEPDLMDGVSVSHAQRAFRVYASPLRELGQKNDLLLLTFFDVSEHKALQAEYKASRPVVAHIIIDNLDEISQNARESDKAMVVGGVDNVLSAWAAPTGGILQLTERGRYLFVFEERYLPGFIADKFSVLDSVRTLGENGALEPTISIGVGAGGESFADNNELARQALERVGLSDRKDHRVTTLSGGERGRVALAKLMLKKDNLLLLDEPTNHLDMDSREVLEDALEEFPGTILAISHDRYFINRFADRVMVMNEDGVTEYLGNFDDYLEKRDRPQPPAESMADGVTKTAQSKERKRDRQQSARIRELRALVKKAEEAIEENERRISELEEELAAPETYADADRMRAATEAYRAEQERTAGLYDELEAAENAAIEAEDA